MLFLIGYVRPLVIAPLDNYSSNESEVLFLIDNADKILIDDNIGFTTPEEYVIEEGKRINLAPGEYYWKAVGVGDSGIRTLRIVSEINLQMKKRGEHYVVVNSGNVRLNIEVYNGSKLIEQRKLSVGESHEVNGNEIVGGQDNE